MTINLQAWDNLFGQALLAFLLIEGLKDTAILYRPSALVRMALNFLGNLAVAWAVIGTGSGLFIGSSVASILAAAVVGALVSAGLHRLWRGVRRPGSLQPDRVPGPRAATG